MDVVEPKSSAEREDRIEQVKSRARPSASNLAASARFKLTKPQRAKAAAAVLEIFPGSSPKYT